MSRLNAKRQEKAAAVKSFWPVGFQRLFLSLNEIPWVSLTAFSTVLGGAVLFLYFRSIGHFPSDLSALFGLGITTAIVSMALLACFAFVLFSPTWLYQHGLADSDPAFQSISRKRVSVALAGLQFGVFGVFLLYFAYQQFICNRSSICWAIAGGVLCIWGGCSLVQTIRIPMELGQRVWSGVCAVLIGSCGLVPIVVLLPLQQALAPTGFLAVLIFFGLFAVIVFLNAFAAPTLVGRKAAAFSLFVAMYLLMVAPLLGANPVFFPTLVAGALGVREAAPQELRIPQKTCQLLLSAAGPNPPSSLQCTAGDWGAVTAQVLSNVGDRWLVQIIRKEVATGDEDVPYLRVTIPKDGIQVITQKEHSSETKQVASSCKRT